MKVIRPSFWKEFQCIGGGCTDNCCIGWEIDIDPETAKKYRKVPGELGERLKKSMRVQEEEISFRMNGERCPFLNGENLCDLILGLGERALCEICREHPRFYEWFGEWKEAGLGLCCEEAVRLLLAEEKPLEFETVEEDEEGFEVDSLWLPFLVKLRAMLMEKLQNREKPLRERFREALALTEQAQECMDQEDTEQMDELLEDRNVIPEPEEAADVRRWKQQYENLLDVFLEMEAMDKGWKVRLEKIREKLPQFYEKLEEFAVCEHTWAYEWEHLAVYNIFRYFLKGIDDEDVLSKTRMAAAGCAMIRLLHMDSWMEKGEVTRWDRICNIKSYSKELEYNLSNLEMLMDAMWEDERFRS